MKAIIIAFLLAIALSDVTVKEIKNVTKSNQLLFAGNISASASSSSNLFFLFYGVQGVTDRTQLSGYPTMVVFGKYIPSYFSPGSSSQYLNFAGMGPLTIASNMTLVTNNNTPSAYSNLMFIDFLGTGFSFANDTK